MSDIPAIDELQIQTFAASVFKYASDGQTVSLRTFRDDGDGPPLSILSVTINGEGLEPLYRAAISQARFASTHSRKAVFCPPLAGFGDPRKADQNTLTEGYALSVECDQRPSEARTKLEGLLGPATFVVASGGLWTDPQTREVQHKLHLHWRLTEPATGRDLGVLKAARALATRLVGGDATNVPVVHPIRWPGSVHRKREPRLAQIVAQSEHEVELSDALDLLREAALSDEALGASPGAMPRGGDPSNLQADVLDVTAALAVIPNDNLDWDEWNRIGMAAWLASSGRAFAAFDAWSQKSGKYDPEATRARWEHYATSPPDRIGAGTLFQMAQATLPGWRKPTDAARATKAEAPERGRVETEQPRAEAGVAEPIFDPWDTWVVPRFPLDILPSTVHRFVSEQSAVVGCDASTLAMTCIANFSAAIHHWFALKLMRHGDWWAAVRIWLMLVGDVSRKKTPVFNTAFAELEAHEQRERAAYCQAMREYEAAIAQWDQKGRGPLPEPPTKPPRFVTSEITPEKMADLLSGSERGILVKRDELIGWIGSMEKYGSRGGAADRAFWLQSYDGGPYHRDRVGRGEVYVSNLSATIVGGVQPQRLAEIKGLTSDGLLQRFIPVMMGPSSFAADVPSSESFEYYRQLTRRLIGLQPARLILHDDALPIMEGLRRHLHDLEQSAEGLAVGFQGFVGKLPGIAGSLALILHLIRDPAGEWLHAVSQETMESVRRLVLDFILPHAFEYYRTAERATDGEKLQRLASWIVTSKQERITVRDLVRNVRDLRGKPVRDIQLAVSPLVAGGWLEPEDPGPENKHWRVLPAVAQQFEARCREEDARKAVVARLMGSPRRAEHG